MCNNVITNIEIEILFWTLIVTIISSLITLLFCVLERYQSAKFNSISILKEDIQPPFTTHLTNNFSYKVECCKYKFVGANEDGSEAKFVFNKIHLIELNNILTTFMGEISFLKFATPIRYNSLNRKYEKIRSHIDDTMIRYASENPTNLAATDGSTDCKLLDSKKSKKIYKKLLKRIKRFYKSVFRIYKYGV